MFLQYLESKNLHNRLLNQYVYFKPDETLMDVIQKIIITNGQLLWIDSDNTLKGMLSLQEIFKLFID